MPAIDPSVCVCVIGAGTMGAGIAQLAAAAGHPVLLFDAAVGAAERGRARIVADLEKLVARGRLDRSAADRTIERLAVAGDVEGLASAGLVIEAIVEDLEVKRRVMAEVEAVVAPTAVLASNTSSISITAIARDLARPERFVGMHFFNPAPVMKLVEVISGIATRPDVAEVVHATATAWGKVAVHARSTPGFIVNRVARHFYGEALRLLEEGVAEPATIDALLTEGGGFKMGPFELMDLIGHDVNYAVSRSVFDAYYAEPRFRPSQLQLELVNAGHLGRKSGRGFYDHAVGAVRPTAASMEPDAQAIPFDDFSLGRSAEIDGVLIVPSDGRRAAQLASAGTERVIVYDLTSVNGWSRIGFAASASVPAEAIERFVATVAAMGGRATMLPDWPGLVVLRTVAMIANEAFEAVLQRVADEAAVDVAMRFGVNYPKGPIAWAREIGLDRVLRTLDAIHALTGDPRYRASMGLRLAVQAEASHGPKNGAAQT